MVRPLRKEIKALIRADPSWADFVDGFQSMHTPIYYRYPAMTVPELQGHILDLFQKNMDEPGVMLDPFAGSGIMLAEGMHRGLDVYAQDINPLAVLLCKVRAGQYDNKSLRRSVDLLRNRILNAKEGPSETEFFGKDKWFTPKIQGQLEVIRGAIRQEGELWKRRFFWMTLAETVRLTCNSRTTTYKMHIRSAENLANRDPDAIKTFNRLLGEFLEAYRLCEESLDESGQLDGGFYKHNTSVRLADSLEGVPKEFDQSNILLTSPPYGDNATTVTYGQSSYLPLNWIDVGDIDAGVKTALVEGANRIDRASLGGVHQIDEPDLKELRKQSRTLARLLDEVTPKGNQYWRKVASFYNDLSRSADSIMGHLDSNALMGWTVGSRRVANTPVVMHKILRQILEKKGARYVHTFERKIHGKRMAYRNEHASTMQHEDILIMQGPVKS